MTATTDDAPDFYGKDAHRMTSASAPPAEPVRVVVKAPARGGDECASIAEYVRKYGRVVGAIFDPSGGTSLANFLQDSELLPGWPARMRAVFGHGADERAALADFLRSVRAAFTYDRLAHGDAEIPRQREEEPPT